MQPPQGASFEQNRLSCKHSVVPERSVPQSVAGAPLAGSLPPAPAERPPAAQTSWATFARCRKGNASQNQAVQPITGKNNRYTASGVLAKKS
ncbi:hypothetical protein [Xenorhabdus nematophila]|uniref:hypothetical protein n=1 Tax=Xenorhabdus nematophila TaxID=628 RepID=UPI001C9AD53F|nr:hypothetical protein [Xenorhabdus nematophila]